MTGWAWAAFSLARAIATIAVLSLTLAAIRDRWGLPAWTGPESPQSPVRMPSREEVNHMTDETTEAAAEAEAEEATEAAAEAETDLGDDPDGDATPDE